MRTINKILCITSFAFLLFLSSCMAANCEHEFGPWTMVNEATCLDYGYEERSCTKCGQSQRRETPPSDKHSYILDFEEAPTCDRQGVTRYSCQYCGDYYEEYKEALEHNFIVHNEQNSSCNYEGYIEYRCSHCGEFKNENLPLTDHNYIEEVISPTCQNEGYTIYTCTTCYHTYYDNYTEKVEHDITVNLDFGMIHKEEEFYISYYCTGCNLYENKWMPSVFREGEVNPIYEVEVLYEGGCGEYCSYRVTYNNEINFTFEINEYIAHQYQWINEKPATCEEDGYTGYYVCDVCAYETEHEILKASGHGFLYENYIINKTPTETEVGLLTKQCRYCNGYKEEIELPVIGDSLYNENIINLTTCYNNGTTRYEFNYDNFYFYFDITVLSTGHDLTHYEAIDATCTQLGHSEYFKCEKCSYVSDYEIYSSLGHDYSPWTFVKEPTYDEGGLVTRTCHRCDREEEKTTSDAMFHSKVDYKEATCYEDGYDKRKVKIENQTLEYTIILLKREHNYYYYYTSSYPTFESIGCVTYHCSSTSGCVTEVILPALTDLRYEATNCEEPTCVKSGYATYSITLDGLPTWSEVISLDALGHKGGVRTCYDYALCDVCGMEYGEEPSHLGGEYVNSSDSYHTVLCVCGEKIQKTHSLGKGYDEKSSSCTSEGGYRQKCIYCDYVLETKYPAIHEFEDGKCKLCGTKEPSSGFVIEPYMKTVVDGVARVEYKITGTTSKLYDEEVYIPTYYEGSMGMGYVTRINSLLGNNSSRIKTIHIPSNIDYIGDGAFYRTSVEVLYISNSKLEFSQNAFVNDFGASYSTTKLVAIYFEGSLSDWVSKISCPSIYGPLVQTGSVYLNSTGNCDERLSEYMDIVIPYGTTTINPYSLYFGPIATNEEVNITIPSTVKSIGAYNLSNTTNRKVTIYYDGSIKDWITLCEDSSQISSSSNKVYFKNELGEYELLTNVVIPNDVEKISKNSFTEFDTLVNITIPNTVKEIGSNAFKNLSNLENIYFNGTLTDWLNISFENMYANPTSTNANFYLLNEEGMYISLKDIVIPKEITKINPYAFYNLSSLTSVVVEDNVEEIGFAAFGNCQSLTNIKIPFVGQKVGQNEFFGYIFGAQSYYDNNTYTKYITDVTLTSSADIVSYAFYNCSSIVNFTFNKTDKIEIYAFSNVNFNNVNYYGTMDDWLNTELVSESSNPISNVNTLHLIVDGKLQLFDGNLIINHKTTKISRYTFYKWNVIKSIKFGSNLRCIETNAFYQNDIEKVYYDGTIEQLLSISTNSNIDIDLAMASSNEGLFMLDDNNEYYQVTQITIPESVSTLKNLAGFDKVTSLTFGPYITSIYQGDLPALENIYYKGSVSDWINASSISRITGINELDKKLYFLDSNNSFELIERLIIPEDVEVIPYGSFQHISNIKDVVFNNTKIISEYAFAYSKIETLNMSDSITNINGRAFLECDSLTSVNVSSNLKSIGIEAFKGTSSLLSITLNEGLTDLGSNVFTNSGLKKISIPSTLQNYQNALNDLNVDFNTDNNFYYLGNADNPYLMLYDIKYDYSSSNLIPHEDTKLFHERFYDSYYLANYNLSLNEIDGYKYLGVGTNLKFMLMEVVDKSKTVIIVTEETKYINRYAFGGLTNVEVCTLPFIGTSIHTSSSRKLNSMIQTENIKTLTILGGDIAAKAFENMKNLSNVTLGNIRNIGSEAFKNCTSLTTVVIPDSVYNLERYIFSGCNNIYSLTTPFMVSDMFTSGSKLSTLTITNMTDVTSIPSTVVNLTLSNKVKSIYLKNSVVNLTYEGTSIEWFNVKKDSFTKYNSNLRIYTSDNQGGFSYSSVRLPDGLESVNDYEFMITNMSSLTIPSSIKHINFYAFNLVTSINNVYFDGTVDDWCNINFEFNPIRLTNNVYFKDENGNYYLANELVISEGVSKISQQAFVKINLTSITIPSSVTYFGANAFTNYNGIIYYNGTIKDWCNITFENYSSLPDKFRNIYVLDENGQYISLVNAPLPKDISNISEYAISRLGSIYYEGTKEDYCNITLPKFYGSHYLYCLDQDGNYYNERSFVVPEYITEIVDYKFSIEMKEIVIPTSVTKIYGVINTEKIYYQGLIEDWLNIDMAEGKIFKDDTKLYCMNEDGEYYLVTDCYINNTEFNVISLCDNITTLKISKNVKTIVGETDNSYIVYYEGLIEDYLQMDGFDSFKRGIKELYCLDENNQYYLVTNVVIENISKIPNMAFGFNEKIESVAINGGVYEIGDGAFYANINLKTVTISDDVRSIGNYAFKDSIRLKEVKINETSKLEEIGDSAFYSCYSLKEILLPNTLKTIGTDVFMLCYKLYNCYNLSNITNFYDTFKIGVLYDLEEDSFIVSGDYVFVIENQKYLLVDYVGADVDLILPKNINGQPYDISYYAFTSYDIRSIVIPEGVEYIRENALYYTKLDELYLPSTIKYIGSGCSSYSGNLINKVYYNGNILQYNKIDLRGNPYNSSLHNLYIVNSYNEYIRYMG